MLRQIGWKSQGPETGKGRGEAEQGRGWVSMGPTEPRAALRQTQVGGAGDWVRATDVRFLEAPCQESTAATGVQSALSCGGAGAGGREWGGQGMVDPAGTQFWAHPQAQYPLTHPQATLPPVLLPQRGLPLTQRPSWAPEPQLLSQPTSHQALCPDAHAPQHLPGLPSVLLPPPVIHNSLLDPALPAPSLTIYPSHFPFPALSISNLPWLPGALSIKPQPLGLAFKAM